MSIEELISKLNKESYEGKQQCQSAGKLIGLDSRFGMYRLEDFKDSDDGYSGCHSRTKYLVSASEFIPVLERFEKQESVSLNLPAIKVMDYGHYNHTYELGGGDDSYNARVSTGILQGQLRRNGFKIDFSDITFLGEFIGYEERNSCINLDDKITSAIKKLVLDRFSTKDIL